MRGAAALLLVFVCLLLPQCGGEKGPTEAIQDRIPAGKLGLLWERLDAKKSTRILLGERVRLRLWMRSDPSLPKEAPDLSKLLPKHDSILLQAQGEGHWGELRQARYYHRDYGLQAVELGKAELPAFRFQLAKEGARCDGLEFQVGAVLPKDAAPKAELPDSLIAELPPSYAIYGYGAGGLLLLLLAFFLWRRLRGREQLRPVPRMPAIPPDRVALGRLQELEQALDRAEIEGEELVLECSRVLRAWLQFGLGIKSLERTTEEFLASLEQGTEVPTKLRHMLAAFLEQCDFVKFAGQHADVSLCRSLLHAARDFVLTTREAPGSALPTAELAQELAHG